MSNLTLNTREVVRWFRDNGDNTHNVNYDLNEDSIIMDLGGYTGVWIQQMVDKYNPNVYVIEPLPEFYNKLEERFKDNSKVTLKNVGVGTENGDGVIYINGDGSSSNNIGGEAVTIQLETMETLLNEWGLESVDLLQVNIEGDEYPLLEQIIENGVINKFKNIQIQFHLGVENEVVRRDQINKGLINNGFKNKFNYPFVWEGWTKEIM